MGIKLHTATISFHRRPLSRKYYGEVRINDDCVYVTENFAYKESAINALKKRIPKLNSLYGYRLAEPISLEEDGAIQRRYAPNPNWDNECYNLTTEEYYERLAQEQAARGTKC